MATATQKIDQAQTKGFLAKYKPEDLAAYGAGTDNKMQPDTGVPATPVAAPTPAKPVPTMATSTAPASPASAPYLNKATDTVEGRMTGLLKQDNEFTKLNETKAAQASNRRNLLNSSMGVQAGRTAAIEASLPIAERDAATSAGFAERRQQMDQQTAADTDRFARDMALKEVEQKGLAYSQVIKGISDINMQDMSKEQKDQAVQNLWSMYLQGNDLYTSLSNVTVKDGKVVREPAPGGTTTGTPAAGGATGTPATGGTASTTTQPKTYLDFQSKADMPEWIRTSYEARYGDKLEPPQVKSIQNVIAYANEKFKSVAGDPRSNRSSRSPTTGTVFNHRGYVQQYEDFLKAELKKVGLPEDLKLVQKVSGYTPPKQEPSFRPFLEITS